MYLLDVYIFFYSIFDPPYLHWRLTSAKKIKSKFFSFTLIFDKSFFFQCKLN